MEPEEAFYFLINVFKLIFKAVVTEDNSRTIKLFYIELFDYDLKRWIFR